RSEVVTRTQSLVWPSSSSWRFTTAVNGTGHWLQLSRPRPRPSKVGGADVRAVAAAAETSEAAPAASALRSASVPWRFAARFPPAARRGEAVAMGDADSGAT